VGGVMGLSQYAAQWQSQEGERVCISPRQSCSGEDKLVTDGVTSAFILLASQLRADYSHTSR